MAENVRSSEENLGADIGNPHHATSLITKRSLQCSLLSNIPCHVMVLSTFVGDNCWLMNHGSGVLIKVSLRLRKAYTFGLVFWEVYLAEKIHTFGFSSRLSLKPNSNASRLLNVFALNAVFSHPRIGFNSR